MNSGMAILLAEDNEDDVFLFRRTLKQAGIEARLRILEDGQQVIDYLSGVGQYADRTAFPLPTVLFLDLKMPYKSGLDVLRWIRARTFEVEPVVLILTSSAESRDVQEAQRLGVRAYFLKPLKPEVLKRIIELASSTTDPLPGDLLDKLETSG